MPQDESQFLHELEIEVAAELRIAQSGHPGEAEESPEQWLFDPADLERNEIGLRGLLGAVQTMEGAAKPGIDDLSSGPEVAP
jgi:hypothetical protein